jgi:hypothetical protein
MTSDKNNNYISTPKQESTLSIPCSNMEKNSLKNKNPVFLAVNNDSGFRWKLRG